MNKNTLLNFRSLPAVWSNLFGTHIGKASFAFKEKEGVFVREGGPLLEVHVLVIRNYACRKLSKNI